MPPATPIRVTVAVAHRLYREAVLAVINSATDLDIAGIVSSSSRFLPALAARHPDAAVLDSEFASPSGMELLGQANLEHPDTRLVFLTSREDDNAAGDALAHGAAAVVKKSSLPDQLIQAIRAR